MNPSQSDKLDRLFTDKLGKYSRTSPDLSWDRFSGNLKSKSFWDLGLQHFNILYIGLTTAVLLIGVTTYNYKVASSSTIVQQQIDTSVITTSHSIKQAKVIITPNNESHQKDTDILDSHVLVSNKPTQPSTISKVVQGKTCQKKSIPAIEGYKVEIDTIQMPNRQVIRTTTTSMKIVKRAVKRDSISNK